jgi:hypothetical protein
MKGNKNIYAYHLFTALKHLVTQYQQQLHSFLSDMEA